MSSSKSVQLYASTAPARADLNTAYLEWLSVQMAASKRWIQWNMSRRTTIPLSTQSRNKVSTAAWPCARQTPTVNVQDFRHRLIGLLEPVHYSMTHGLQALDGLLTRENKRDNLGILIAYTGKPLSWAFTLPRQLLHHLPNGTSLRLGYFQTEIFIGDDHVD